MGRTREQTRFAWLVALAALPAAGCLNPSSYGTPRTTPVGEVQHSVSIEYLSFRGVAAGAYHRQQQGLVFYDDPGIANGHTLSSPSYGFRVGATDRLDLGARFPSAGAVRLDLKWNFVRSDTFDVAVNPGAQAFYKDDGHFLLMSPLIFGINASPSFSIVPRVGLAYGSDAGGVVYGDKIAELAKVEAWFLLAGLGLEFRTSDEFALHPEMSMLRSASAADDMDITWYTFGIGFNWGVLPRYGQPEPGAP